MFFDPERMVFAYFADRCLTAGGVLNSVALQYCLRYSCMHFYIDESDRELPLSPIAALLRQAQEEERRHDRRKKLATTTTPTATTTTTTTTIAAKFTTPGPRPVVVTSTKQQQQQDVIKHKFRYMGKLSGGWTPLLVPPPQSPLQQQQSTIYDTMFMDVDHRRTSSSSYADFKKKSLLPS